MKTIFKSLVLIAAAALTLSACSKPENINPVDENEVVTLKFNIRNADEASLTKALLGTENGKNFLNWENGDHIGAYLTGSANAHNRQGEVEVLGDDYSLNVQAPNTMTVQKIYSYFPYSVGAGTNKEAAIVTIPELQHMTSEGFDADAMPMAGSPVDVSINITTANSNYDCGKIDFSNLGSIIKFRVYTSGTTSETLTSVTYKAAGIGGSFSIDLTKVDAADESTLSLTSTDAVNEITTSYATKPSISSGLDNAIDVYMVVAPGSYTGSQVVVTTNEHTYTLNASGEKTFTRSHVKPIKVDISKGTPGDLPIDEVWVKKSISDITSEDVLVIVGTNSAGSYAMSNNNGTGSAPGAIGVTIADDKITSEVANTIKWNVSGNVTDGYTFYPNGSTETWLYCTNTNNGVRVGTSSNKVFTIDGGYLKHISTSRYVGIYNSQDWRCYTSNGGNIENQTLAFYVKTAATPDTRQEASMSWSAASATASWNTGNTVSGFTAPTLTEGNATGITYESTNTEVATISNAGVVSIVGPGETTIKAIFAGDTNYKPQTVSYTLTVADNRETVATPTFDPDATNTVAPGTGVTISCTTSGATIYYTLDGSAPTNASTTYTGAIALTESKTIKAIAIKDGYKDSAVATAAYTVGVVNTSTEANPYSVAEADDLCGQLPDNGTLANVYVSGIISEITTAYSSQFNNVSFHISADGLTTGTQFTIFRAAATSADDFKVGDAVEFKGTLKNYKSGDNYTHELDANATLIYQVHAPVISPDGASFTDNQSVTITADTDATIYYTTDGNAPTASSSAYTAAFTVTETTTVKAIAIKDGHSTGVVSATFTKGGGDAVYSLYSGDITEGDYVIVYSGKAMKNTVSSNRLGYVEVTVSNDQIVNPEASIVWHIAASGSYWTIYNSAVAKYAASTGTKNQAGLNSSSTDNKSLWTVTGNSTYEFVNKNNNSNNVNANLRNNGTYGFACYATGTGGALSLYKLN